MPKPSKPRAAKKPKPAAPEGLASGNRAFAVATLLISAAAGLFYGRSSGPAGPVTLTHASGLRVAECSKSDYRPAFAGCTPSGAAGSCGGRVIDDFASIAEVDALAALAQRGMAMGGGSGGPTILDLQSGALSLEDKFVDVWTAFNVTGRRPFTVSDVAVYRDAVARVGEAIGAAFGVRGLMLTAPSFFSRISAEKPAKIANDEYWHVHVDSRQYGSFVYTALLYLTDAGTDFDGGLFHFMPPESGQRETPGAYDEAAVPAAVVTPKKGRLVLFSSGHEHPHRVTQVTRGSRLALTVAFTCDARAAIGEADFLSRAVPDGGEGA